MTTCCNQPRATSHASSTATISPTDHSRSVTPAAMAGVTRSVLWMRQGAASVRRRTWGRPSGRPFSFAKGSHRLWVENRDPAGDGGSDRPAEVRRALIVSTIMLGSIKTPRQEFRAPQNRSPSQASRALVSPPGLVRPYRRERHEQSATICLGALKVGGEQILGLSWIEPASAVTINPLLDFRPASTRIVPGASQRQILGRCHHKNIY
jgi:hypothetical protein